MNQTESTIKKIEESLSSQNYDYSQKPDPLRKVSRLIWAALGVVLLLVTFVTITGWLTIETEAANIYQNTPLTR